MIPRKVDRELTKVMSALQKAYQGQKAEFILALELDGELSIAGSNCDVDELRERAKEVVHYLERYDGSTLFKTDDNGNPRFLRTERRKGRNDEETTF